MLTLFTTLLLNINTVIVWLLSIHGVALAIVNLTPTPQDNVWLTKIYRVIEALAGILHIQAKEPLPADHVRALATEQAREHRSAAARMAEARRIEAAAEYQRNPAPMLSTLGNILRRK